MKGKKDKQPPAAAGLGATVDSPERGAVMNDRDLVAGQSRGYTRVRADFYNKAEGPPAGVPVTSGVCSPDANTGNWLMVMGDAIPIDPLTPGALYHLVVTFTSDNWTREIDVGTITWTDE
jgi:hypothetical protein